MKRLASFIVVAILAMVAVVPKIEAVDGFTVSGTISLLVAPESSLSINCFLLTQEGNQVPGKSAMVTVAANETLGMFAIPAVNPGTYKLMYQIATPGYDTVLLGRGFFNSAAGVSDEYVKASEIVVSGHVTELEMQIPAVYRVEGSLSLPIEENVQSEDLRFQVWRWLPVGLNEYEVKMYPEMSGPLPSDFSIPASQRSVQFNFYTIPGNYLFGYNLGTVDDPIFGFYAEDGTVSYLTEGTLVPVFGPVIGLDMTIIELGDGQPPVSNPTLSGSITLPRAYDSAIDVQVALYSSNATQSPISTTMISIPAQSTEQSYSLQAPEGEYIVKYSVQFGPHSPANIPWESYYTTGNLFVNNAHSATPVVLNANGETGINIALPQLYDVSGTLNIPTSIEHGATVAVIMANGKTYNTSVSSFSVPISQPEPGSFPIALRVPVGEYYLYYQVTNSTQYLSPGYYAGSTQTSADSDLAVKVAVGTSGLEDLSLELLPVDSSAPQLGDVDGDGVIDVRDAIIILQHAKGLLTLTGEPLQLADTNGDGLVDQYDAVNILKQTIGTLK